MTGYDWEDNADAWWHQMDLENRRYLEELHARNILPTKENAMKFPARNSTDFTPPPAGNHLAICTGVVELGLQPGSAQFPDPKHQVYIRFELPDVPTSEENPAPMMTGRTFTASMNEKANLRKFIESWFSKPFASDTAAERFDLKDLMGRRCLLNITHKERDGKTRAKVENATPLPKGMSSTQHQHNANVYYSLEESSEADLARVPEWLQKKINERLAQPGGLAKAKPVDTGDDPDDLIPF
jgi:hypothetical protein